MLECMTSDLIFGVRVDVGGWKQLCMIEVRDCPLFDGMGLLYDIYMFVAMYEHMKLCIMGLVDDPFEFQL